MAGPRRRRGGGRRVDLGAWHEVKDSSARGRGRWKLWRDAWRSSASRRWLPGCSTAAGGAALSAGGVKQRKQAGRLEVEGSGLVRNFRNSRDPTVN